MNQHFLVNGVLMHEWFSLFCFHVALLTGQIYETVVEAQDSTVLPMTVLKKRSYLTPVYELMDDAMGRAEPVTGNGMRKRENERVRERKREKERDRKEGKKGIHCYMCSVHVQPLCIYISENTYTCSSPLF